MKSRPQIVPWSALAFLSIGLASGCRTTSAQTASDSPGAFSAAPRPVEAGESPLYARDGTVVGGLRPDATAEPRHDVSARDGSRMYLLELYQKTVEEKDGLAREVQSLQVSVTRAGEMQSAVEKERDAARAETLRLTRELERAQSDNTELAARLVTAQIRRLEAEKLLLEARIEALRREGSSSAGTPIETSAPRGAPTSKEKPKSQAPEAAHGGGHE